MGVVPKIMDVQIAKRHKVNLQRTISASEISNHCSLWQEIKLLVQMDSWLVSSRELGLSFKLWWF